MTRLRSDLVLRRAPNLLVRVESASSITILALGKTVACGSTALAVLDAFTHPTTVSAAIERMQVPGAGAQHWMDLTSTVLRLFEAGVLQDDSAEGAALSTGPVGFDTAEAHAIMLNDRARTEALLAAVTATVRPGDVVVDIGTGTGVLAIAAARAGASHVYAVEGTAIGAAAREMFDANGVADRITLLEGWSSALTLPTRADVLIAEIIGHEPLDEGALETILDARKRLLVASPRIVPSRLRICALPLMIPAAELEKRTFATARVDAWRGWYGIDFEPLRRLVTDLPQSFLVRTQRAREWTALGASVLLADIDFSTVTETALDTTAAGTAALAGELNGVLVYFELELGGHGMLSSHPARADAANHWASLVWVPSQSLAVRPGDRFSISYRYRVPGAEDRLLIRPA